MGEAFVWVSIFVIFGLAIIALILSLSRKAEAKETTGEGKGWYTAEMKADYTNAVNERKKAFTDLMTRFELGMFEAIHYSRELKEAEDILFHAYHTKKITQEELQARLKTVLHDLDRKYPNAREFVTAFSVKENPNCLGAHCIFMEHHEEVVRAFFRNEWHVELANKYRNLYIDILKNEKIINYKKEN